MRGWFIKSRAVCKQRGQCQQSKGCDDRCLAFLWNIQLCKMGRDNLILVWINSTVQLKLKRSYYMSLTSVSLLPSRDLGTTSIPYSPSREPAPTPHQPLAPPSGPLAYGGGAEGRKRRSPSSYRGKASKLSRPSGLESLFGKGNDIGGILASGPESPRQVGVTSCLFIALQLKLT